MAQSWDLVQAELNPPQYAGGEGVVIPNHANFKRTRDQAELKPPLYVCVPREEAFDHAVTRCVLFSPRMKRSSFYVRRVTEQVAKNNK